MNWGGGGGGGGGGGEFYVEGFCKHLSEKFAHH